MNNIDNQDLSERVQKYVKRQKAAMRWGFLGTHATMFALALFAVINEASDPSSGLAQLPESGRDIFIVLLVLWFISLAFHLGSTLAGTGILDKQLAAQGVTRELGKQFVEQQFVSDKPKRDTARLDADYVTVNEEGELIPDGEHHRADQASPRTS